MSTEVKTFKRKVTFTISREKNVRVFTPVNKRAQAFAAIAGTPTLQRKHLLAIRALGFRVAEGKTLNPIAL